MDKENLYYIVKKGTNDRVLNSIGTPLLIEKRAIEDSMEWNRNYEAISIKDYEEKYEVRRCIDDASADWDAAISARLKNQYDDKGEHAEV